MSRCGAKTTCKPPKTGGGVWDALWESLEPTQAPSLCWILSGRVLTEPPPSSLGHWVSKRHCPSLPLSCPGVAGSRPARPTDPLTHFCAFTPATVRLAALYGSRQPSYSETGTSASLTSFRLLRGAVVRSAGFLIRVLMCRMHSRSLGHSCPYTNFLVRQ